MYPTGTREAQISFRDNSRSSSRVKRGVFNLVLNNLFYNIMIVLASKLCTICTYFDLYSIELMSHNILNIVIAI